MLTKNLAPADGIIPRTRAVNISREQYEIIFNAILEVLNECGKIRFRDLHRAVTGKIKTDLNGLLPLYTTVIKRRMEREGIIERIAVKNQQYLRLIGKN